MRRWVVVVLLSLVAAPALAVFCARDVVPAATLLVPYIEVKMAGDVPDRDGMTTIVRVTNTAAEATLVQLVVWNALGEPVTVIHAALSGYDMWTVDFADVLEGRWSRFDTSRSPAAFPNTETMYLKRTPFEVGPDGRSGFNPPVRAPYTSRWSTGLPDPGKTSELDGNGCGMPYGDTAGLAYAPLIVEKLEEPLFAREQLRCGERGVRERPFSWLSSLTPDPLFFYATVNAVRVCSPLTPADEGYAGQVAADRNVLTGAVTFLDPAAGTLSQMPAVHIEAALTSEEAAVLGPFEARWGHEDRREPLATAFAIHYEKGDLASSALMLWKPFAELVGLGADGKVGGCGAYTYYAWDQDEHVITRGSSCPPFPVPPPDSDPNMFPFMSQLVPLTVANFDLPADSGWILLQLPPSYDGFTQDPTPGDSQANSRYQGVAAVRTRVLAGDESWAEAAVVGHAQCVGVGGGR